MSEWKTYKLSEVAEIKYGKDHKHLAVGNIPVYGSGGIMRYADTFLYDKESILIPRKGTLSNLFYINKPFWSVDTMFYTKIKKGNNGKYLFYLLKSMDLASMDVGSAVPSLTTEVLNKIEINVPDEETQVKIASLLSSLDDKIELNLQMNQTLETMAQTIFKEWFVNFNFPGFDGELVDGLPKGWRVGKLRNVLELVYGKALKADTRAKGNFPVIGSSGIVGYHNEYLVNAPGIVIGRKGTIGEVIWVNENFFPIDTTFYVNDLLGVGGLYFHYFLLKGQEFKKIASDSAVPGLNRHQAMNNVVTIPDVNLIKVFNSVIQSIFEKKEANANQNKSLTQIRDSLLPKLMTGKIEVKG